MGPLTIVSFLLKHLSPSHSRSKSEERATDLGHKLDLALQPRYLVVPLPIGDDYAISLALTHQSALVSFKFKETLADATVNVPLNHNL